MSEQVIGQHIDPATTTVREMVVEDYRTAAVFGRYGLDFCCGGGATIARACEKKGVEVDRLVADLEEVRSNRTGDVDRAASWSPALLVDYIEANHHAWVRSVLPSMTEHAAKVARVHGNGRPALGEIARLVEELGTEMLEHMEKEETRLFPLVRSGSDDVASVVAELEAEHTDAGSTMAEIRRLTDDFTPPEDACTTWRVLYDELAAFETDLHRHVHLENNILFRQL